MKSLVALTAKSRSRMKITAHALSWYGPRFCSAFEDNPPPGSLAIGNENGPSGVSPSRGAKDWGADAAYGQRAAVSPAQQRHRDTRRARAAAVDASPQAPRPATSSGSMAFVESLEAFRKAAQRIVRGSPSLVSVIE